MDNVKLFFSVIIPTLNEERFLPKLLEDLEKQKDKDFEVIIVDSDSEDKTKEVALSFKKLPLRFFGTERHNVSHQRNYGAKQANGKYLAFLDADSRINATFTRNAKAVILKKKGLVFIPRADADTKDPQTKIMFDFINFLIESSHSIGKPFSTGGTMIWEKNFFDLIGGFDEKLFISEDHNIVQRALQWGVRAKFSPFIKYRFSLRRFRKEGQLSVLYKYLLATAHFLVEGGVKKRIFDYQMGGGNYKAVKETSAFNEGIKKKLRLIKDFFEDNLS